MKTYQKNQSTTIKVLDVRPRFVLCVNGEVLRANKPIRVYDFELCSQLNKRVTCPENETEKHLICFSDFYANFCSKSFACVRKTSRKSLYRKHIRSFSYLYNFRCIIKMFFFIFFLLTLVIHLPLFLAVPNDHNPTIQKNKSRT